MAVISMMGFLVRGFDTVTPISPDAWTYWWSSVPVIIVGAPLGAAFIANRSKNFIIGLLLTSIVAQFVAALVILPLTSGRIAMVCAVLGLGSWVFHSFAQECRRRTAYGVHAMNSFSSLTQLLLPVTLASPHSSAWLSISCKTADAH